jgi:hypothetical protein
MMTEQNKRDCIEDFKRNANDPSSFQIAGDWFIDPYLIPSQSHPSDLINVTLPMRAKNAMGALVKSELHCYYKFDDPSKRLTFDFSLQEHENGVGRSSDRLSARAAGPGS